ncbi:hypothetical protein CWE15_06410 [Aliidiomarina taiwanensis]|uniref:6-hydroxymethylpterin diphosphokinase MptE-like domain-containing protein n=1 Tax=Aliidiomarina taiwanensis TaxID=946228 RepID=A0A432X877_9GAMM|nr:6-hydroxymethylpterin diphosphokinase MptE-like protein [Aliidiomarina taiwanensis]RUO43030.1 hypothetical protein CWE15_06410 [Aliidiomarina taiwanensis]
MFFRDFRHQIEPDEDKQRLFLQAARERFYANLSLLQLQLPELAEQLRALQPSQYTLTCDRSGHGNCVHQHSFTMAWPPAAFEPPYGFRSLEGAKPVLIAAELHYSGQQLVKQLCQHPTPFALLYIPSLELFHASLHAVDWLPVLHNTQLVVQLESHVPAAKRFSQDLQTLAEHRVAVEPACFAAMEENPEQLAAERLWHFQQCLQYNHDCDPVLRLHTHKYKWQHEFRLQNLLIEKLRQRPMPSKHGFTTLILCGYTPEILSEATEIQGLKRVILLTPHSVPQQLLRQLLDKKVQLYMCTGTTSEVIEQFVQLIHQLPGKALWQCRVYQADSNNAAKQIRQNVELELRYIVQPAMGVRRCLDAAHQVSAVTQHLITRRTELPNNPILLLGNGPSLTATLEAIQAGHAEGYLLVSCGTTLATLHAHGITPHIHLELEFHSKALLELNKDYLAKVHLCAPLGFQHGIRTLFGSHSSFILAGHAFDELVPGLPDDTIQVHDAFPTVLNLGLALFAQLGAKELWIAGFDLAFVNHDQHHAIGSIYDQQNPQHYFRATGELLEVTTIHNMKAHTKREFQFSALQARLIISRFPRMQAYQLSPGLDLGARYRESIEPYSGTVRWPLKRWSLSSAQVNWQRPQHFYRCSELFAPLATATAEELEAALEQHSFKLSLAKLEHQPAVYWSLSLRRTIAALLLRLQVGPLTDLQDAHEAFQLMLEDFIQAEAKI